VVIMVTILLLERDAQEHDQTAVSLGFSRYSSLSRISIMEVLYCHYHLFSQNFTGWHDNVIGQLAYSLSSSQSLSLLLLL